MRGDTTRWTAAGDDNPPVRRGPRHAAPRKSLLTKLQIPAGKAMALAAMPTAVFVGMGLTPRLALASDSQDIPFLPGPCVTRSDEPEPSESPSGSPSPSASVDPSDSATPGPTPTGSGTATEPHPSASSAPVTPPPDAPPPDAPQDGDTAPTVKPTATPTPTPTKSAHPLDPLGLGDVLGDLLGGKKSTPPPAPDTTTPPPEQPVPTPSETGSSSGKSTSESTSEPTSEPTSGPTAQPDRPTEPAGSGTDDSAKSTEDAIKEAADKAGATVEELDKDAKGLDAREDEEIPEGADGKEPFPCPTADPEALANAELEPGIPRLANEPWTLKSSLLTLNGLDYHGIVEVETAGGELKKVLKFTASSLDIKDLHQSWIHPAGGVGHTTGGPGTTSTIRGAEVTMYTEQLKGNLFGLIPITFSPATPPPLNIPFAFFTDVTVLQAGQFGGTLTIPHLKNYVTN
ncbi:hypothetical protein [Streptomyces liangshanensis]|uniref:Hydrogenase expression protein HypF n=1 Tax=Streptomyces liangshanensis TaxID=2717324 RepID=A0A6G9GWI0_9ACTN|nr:hypothetical protein [Streptomyces liangshanensis]QIQ02618.1 hypothetical protein HA039_10070 [Streptomyces liangshanensis]